MGGVSQPVDAFGSPIYPGLSVAYATSKGGIRKGVIQSLHRDRVTIRVIKRTTWGAKTVNVRRFDRIFIDHGMGDL